MNTFSFVMLLLSYTGDIKGLPIATFPSAAECTKTQDAQEQAHKDDYIILSACVPKATTGTNIAIRIEPGNFPAPARRE